MVDCGFARDDCDGGARVPMSVAAEGRGRHRIRERKLGLRLPLGRPGADVTCFLSCGTLPLPGCDCIRVR